MAAIAEAREEALGWAFTGPTGPFLCLWPKALSTPPRRIVAVGLGHGEGLHARIMRFRNMRMPIVIVALASLSALLPACAGRKKRSRMASEA